MNTDLELKENTCAFCKHVKVIWERAGCSLDGEERDIFLDTCEKFEYEDDDI